MSYITDILNYAKSAEPEEACGFLLESPDGRKFFPCKNIAENPQRDFEIASEDWERAEAEGEISAIVHSHPDGGRHLSSSDRFYQGGTLLPWLLVSEGKVFTYRNMPHLLGRFDGSSVRLVEDFFSLCGLGELDVRPDNLAGSGFFPTDNFSEGDLAALSEGVLGVVVGDKLLMFKDGVSQLSDIPEQGTKFWKHPNWLPDSIQGALNDMEWQE